MDNTVEHRMWNVVLRVLMWACLLFSLTFPSQCLVPTTCHRQLAPLRVRQAPRLIKKPVIMALMGAMILHKERPARALATAKGMTAMTADILQYPPVIPRAGRVAPHVMMPFRVPVMTTLTRFRKQAKTTKTPIRRKTARAKVKMVAHQTIATLKTHLVFRIRVTISVCLN